MARDYRPSKCRSCGESIMWVKTLAGRNMPINYDEDLEHEFVGRGKKTPQWDSERMASHFETCPFAKEHRK